jgi:hypothetical protein
MYTAVTMLVFANVYTQQLPKHEKKVYRAPDGKLYIQKTLPVYVRIATSSDDNAKTYLLRSEKTPKYANPMYFDAEGFNSFRSPSKVDTITKMPVYPKEDIIFEVYADNTPPASSIKFENNETKKIKDITYIRGKANISVKAEDKLSGLENIYYSVDSAEYSIYNAPFSLDSEKEYSLKYYSVDNVGNVESLHNMKLTTDFTSPKTSYTIKGNYFENMLAGNASLHFTASDKGAGISNIRYKLDDGLEKTYTTPINAANLDQGEHKIAFYATDLVNNKESENTFEFYVDKTPPTVIQEIIGKSFIANGKEFSSGRSQLKITAFDNKAGIKEIYYSINNGKYQLYEKPVNLANSSGNLTVKSYAVDNVNNIGYYNENDNKASRNLSYVDLSGPVLSSNFSGPVFTYNDSVYINQKTKIILKAYDKESGFNRIEYTVNQGETNTYEAPINIDKEGYSSINFTGYDNVDNTNNSSISFFVDNTGPEISIQFSTPVKLKDNGTDIYPDHVVLFVAATDAYTGFDRMTYSFNGLPEKLFAGYISAIPKQKLNTLLIKAYDKLGNETRKEIKFGIEI